ncbi:hypothetical protein MTR67_051601 [Solanum verrucosum]|uniref:C3H1-type domain-containing protein n=1 Tax=Solanum verrucosum TaxID=315347 RepID=A0AAF1A0A1_SOLVR|nr:hypothetical protein MTR67_051601 [Solanum verrucosum]
MSFSDQSTYPPHFMPMSFADGDAGGVWPHSPMNYDRFESYWNISDRRIIETSKHENDIVRFEMPTYLKTKICIKWETTGQCSFRDRCHFAHGQSELQAPVMMNYVPITPRPFYALLVANTVVNASVKEEKGEKKILKWKPSKKSAEIYRDCLDGYVPPHLLFRNTES